MAVREGYKQTEVGVIPEDWEVTSFEQICKVNQGLQIAIARRKRNPSKSSKVYITVQSINSNDEPKYIDDYSNSVCCEPDDVLMTRTGNTGIVVTGETGVFHNNFFKIKFNRKKINSVYFVYYLRSHNCQKTILEKAGTSTIPDLNHGDFYSIQIVFPSFTEQTAIANALSDVDALIQSLSALIAKKRLIKQGAMQTLLNPYDENGQLKDGWVVKKLPEVCWYQEGPGVRNSQFTKSGVKLLNGTNIENGKLLLDKTNRYISEKEAYGWYSHFLANEGDILIACSGITVDRFHEKVTVISKGYLPLCMNTSTMRFKVDSKRLQHSYLIHFLRSRAFKDQIGGMATGSAQLNFGPSHVNSVDIYLPMLNEQAHVAGMLSDMDSEITSLETKLAKFQAIKQGMMQNLLTGHIRLIQPEAVQGE